jgi:pimeloyl-ACP methyl ester carboxylesterase
LDTERLEFESLNGPLEATLDVPDGAIASIVVMVPGSGPVTRDGVSTAQLRPGLVPPFKAWAEILGSVGHCSARYDKSVAAYQTLYAASAAVVRGIEDEYWADIRGLLGALAANRRWDGVSRFLLGHSLGAIGALSYAAREGRVRGVICVNPPVLDLAAVLKAQLEAQLPPREYAAVAAQLDRAVEGEPGVSPFGAPASYWRDYARNRLAVLLGARPGSLPVLVVKGAKDPLDRDAGFEQVQRRFTGADAITFSVVGDGDHFLMTRPPGDEDPVGGYELTPVIDWLAAHAGR